MTSTAEDPNTAGSASLLTLHLTITAEKGAPRVDIQVPKTANATELRQAISSQTKIPMESLRVIYRGRLISNDDQKNAVAEYKLEENSVLHCMGKPQTTTPETTISSTPASSTATATPTTTTTATPVASASTSSTTTVDPLPEAIRKLQVQNSQSDYATAVSTLNKILSNIVKNPMEEKYRQMKKSNPAFQRRLGGLHGGHECMLAAGFVIESQDGQDVYVMQASADKWPQLQAAHMTVERAAQQSTTASLANQPPAAASSSLPGMPPNLGMGGGMPGWGSGTDMPQPNSMEQAMMSNLLSDPNALQAMMQNPMVQNMIRNDPRMANNPMMQQAMTEIANNPALAQQMSQMMRDPAMMAQMQQHMRASGNMPPFGGGMPNWNAAGGNGGMGGAANASANTSTNNSSSGATADQDMTEEEMIAEAIRRSLQDDNNNNN